MKKYIPHIIVFALGIGIGLLCRERHFRDATKMVQRDTIVRYDTIRYSRIQLVGNTDRLDSPNSGNNLKLVYVPLVSVDTVYRDNVRYVTMPRERYYTKVDCAEVWHSGIDSRIDSLNVFRENVKITERIGAKSVKNRLSLGVETAYLGALYTPAYVRYERRLKPWLSVYGGVCYDLPRSEWGANIGLSMQIEW